ncbi:MAG: ABC-2 family transporter protein [Planctomycetes bacterium]|nr:ABC-2 family transporter protein [Planctomycetota bacterium]
MERSLSKSVRGFVAFARAILVINIKATFAQRGAFWLQASFMLVNNLIFCVTWFIFFSRFDEINGWRLSHMLLLYAIVAMSFGASVALSGGVRDLARTIVDGDLDTFLTQPKSVIAQAVCSRSFAMGWGDLASGVFLLLMSGAASWTTLPLIAVCVACGWTIFVSTAIVTHSAAFWIGSVQDLARHSTQFTVTFSVYPQNIYGGWVKLLLFTAVPAGFIGYLPVTLVTEFEWSNLFALLGAALAYATLASTVFHFGLRRYESGNRLGVRA